MRIRSRSEWPEACSPASVFTSIGKKVITATTAATRIIPLTVKTLKIERLERIAAARPLLAVRPFRRLKVSHRYCPLNEDCASVSSMMRW